MRGRGNVLGLSSHASKDGRGVLGVTGEGGRLSSVRHNVDIL
jgi:hypothetical protein